MPLQRLCFLLAGFVAYHFWPRPNAASAPATITKISEWNRPIGNPILSPDGRTIAFTSSVNGYDQLFVMLTSGGQPLQLTKDEGNKRPLAFSGDGNEILFGPSIGDFEIWSIPTLGGSPRRLGNGVVVTPSSDGRSLLIATLDHRILRSDSSGLNPEVLATLTADDNVFQLLASPDGKGLYIFCAAPGKFLVKKLEFGSPNPVVAGEIPGAVGWTSWAQAGKSLYVSRLVKDIVNIWEYSLADGSLRQITFGPGPDTYPLADPSGKGLYFVNGRASGVLTLYRAATKQSSDLVSELATQPLISPSSRKVAYITQPESGKVELWVANIDGSNPTKVYSSNRYLDTLRWSSDDTQFIFTEWAGAATDGRLYSVHTDGTQLRQLPSPPGRSAFAALIPGTSYLVVTNYKGIDAQTTHTWKLDLKDPNAKPEELYTGCNGALAVSPDGNYILGPILWGDHPGMYQYSLRDKKCTPLKPNLPSYFAEYGRDGKSFSSKAPRAARPRFIASPGKTEKPGESPNPRWSFPLSCVKISPATPPTSPRTFPESSTSGPTATTISTSCPRDKTARHGLTDRAACNYCLRNASRSALIVSAWVVGMPCGKSLKVFMAEREGFELEPSCGRLSPQAKSRARRGTSDLKAGREVMAEREGFEPPIPVKVWPLSRRLVSTTHAPLRARLHWLELPAHSV